MNQEINKETEKYHGWSNYETWVIQLQKSYRKHWINAFFELKYNKDLSDKENLDLFFNWAYDNTWGWNYIKEQLKAVKG